MSDTSPIPRDLKPARPAWVAGIGQVFQSPSIKLLLIGALLLIMLIPTAMIEDVIRERQYRQQAVEDQFAAGWGPQQSVASPLLAVPWSLRGPGLYRHGTLYLPPVELTAAAKLTPQTRALGFFRAVIYTADVHLEGHFDPSSASVADAPGAVLDWQSASLVLGASDLRGINQQARLAWGGSQLPYVHRDREDLRSAQDGRVTYLEAKLPAIDPAQAKLAFATDITLRGVHSFNLVPLGPRTLFSLAAPWATPSFAGASLPIHYDVTKDSFTAQWDIASVMPEIVSEARGTVPGANSDCCAHQADFRSPGASGAALLEALPTYHMVERAAKYAMLFITLCFLTYFVFERLAGIAIGAVSYALLGISMAFFSLLLLAIGEQLGFSAAYAVSVTMVAGQGVAYTWLITRRRNLSAIFAMVQAALFGFLYIVLSLETYALLSGALALFAVLSILMAVTGPRRREALA